jgi:hypothetical protein
MKRLTHLGGFTYELNVLEGSKASLVLRRFADACPTLAFVELRSRNESSRWAVIKRRRDDGRYVRWDLLTSLRGIRMEDWSGHLDPSTSNLNWDKRILVFKNSQPSAPGRRLNPLNNIIHKRMPCGLNPFVVLILVVLCAAVGLTLLWVRDYCSRFFFAPRMVYHWDWYWPAASAASRRLRFICRLYDKYSSSPPSTSPVLLSI